MTLPLLKELNKSVQSLEKTICYLSHHTAQAAIGHLKPQSSIKSTKEFDQDDEADKTRETFQHLLITTCEEISLRLQKSLSLLNRKEAPISEIIEELNQILSFVSLLSYLTPQAVLHLYPLGKQIQEVFLSGCLCIVNSLKQWLEYIVAILYKKVNKSWLLKPKKLLKRVPEEKKKEKKLIKAKEEKKKINQLTNQVIQSILVFLDRIQKVDYLLTMMKPKVSLESELDLSLDPVTATQTWQQNSDLKSQRKFSLKNIRRKSEKWLQKLKSEEMPPPAYEPKAVDNRRRRSSIKDILMKTPSAPPLEQPILYAHWALETSFREPAVQFRQYTPNFQSTVETIAEQKEPKPEYVSNADDWRNQILSILNHKRIATLTPEVIMQQLDYLNNLTKQKPTTSTTTND